MGALVIGADGGLTMTRADDRPPLGLHDDLVELPILLWEGARVVPSGAGPATSWGTPAPRAAIGLLPGGRVLIARGTFASDSPLVEALTAAGCTRALALDRGVRASGFLDRAGTPDAPRARYEESVLYALGVPLAPRGFRFQASAMVAQAPKPKAP
jgi:hypothetical protein